jgi:hypothetical protein
VERAIGAAQLENNDGSVDFAHCSVAGNGRHRSVRAFFEPGRVESSNQIHQAS